MTTGSPSNPFLAGPMITDPRYFVGRKAELDAITSRMTGSQPVSLNVVGRRRIGKSSLLYHFFQTYEQRVQDPNRYAVIYLDLQDAQYHRENKLYHAIAEQLYYLPKVRSQNTLTRPFQKVKTFERQTFSAVMAELKRQGLLPVLCLDEFEALFSHPQEFDNGFFDNLRSLMNGNNLMLVVASHRKLDFYRDRYGLTSSFFNLGHTLVLEELTEGEAKELLVSLPGRMGFSSGLSLDEQRLAREWGKCHPFLLQLAGYFLWEARQQGQNVGWAKARFDQEAQRVPRAKFNFTKLLPLLRLLLWNLPVRLGKMVKNIGLIVNDAIAWGIGISLIVLIVLTVLGLIPGTQVNELVKKFLCSSLSGALGKWCDG